jgi:gliding motility-associated-like protein
MYFSDTCQNASSLFTGIELSPVQGIQSWRWSFGDGQSGTANPIQHRYTNAGDYPITLYAVSADGCVSDTLEDEISIAPLAAFAGYDTLVARNQPVQLMASGGNIYQWSPSFGLDDPNARNPVATLTQDMTYYLKVFTENGCIGFDTLNIIVYDGPEIYVPNVFTPNGDGLNDLFSAFPVGMKSVQYFSVYNRLGLLIFTSNNRFQKWDGKFKGTKQPTGTYVWVADGVDYRGQRIQRKGTVLLLN